MAAVLSAGLRFARGPRVLEGAGIERFGQVSLYGLVSLGLVAGGVLVMMLLGRDEAWIVRRVTAAGAGFLVMAGVLVCLLVVLPAFA